MTVEVEVQERDAGDDRQNVPLEVKLQEGGLPTGSPGSTPAVGPLAQPALAAENDGPALYCCVSPSERHSSFFQGPWAAQPRLPEDSPEEAGVEVHPAFPLDQTRQGPEARPVPAIAPYLSLSRIRSTPRRALTSFGSSPPRHSTTPREIIAAHSEIVLLSLPSTI